MKAVGTVLLAVLNLVIFGSLLCIANPNRPRGVALTNGQFYSDSYWFTCLDGSQKLEKSKVNDDYCDCADGTDEPGTSACPHGKFHCNNRGYRPIYIPSSWVNDGLCDCCDTSDEYTGPGAQICINNCRELGKEEIENKQKERIIQNRGFELRKEYIQQAEESRLLKKQDLQTLQARQEELEQVRDEKERLKEEVEAPEKEAMDRHHEAWNAEKERRQAERDGVDATRAFTELDTNQDGFVSVEEIQTHPELDPDSSGDLTEEEAMTLLNDARIADLHAFKTTSWEKLKGSYEFSEESAAEVQEDEVTPTVGTPPPAEPILPPDDDEYDEDEDGNDDDDDDAAAFDEEEDYDDEYDDEYVEEDYDDEDPELMKDVLEKRQKERMQRLKKKDKKGDDEEMPEYDEATKALIRVADAARAEFNDIDKELKALKQNISNIEKNVGVDVGPQLEFQPLQNQCFEYTDREYKYRLCAFEKVTQSPKNGGSETSLGRWGEWAGPSDDKYSAMKYTNGQSCWNGPNRSSLVKLKCGITNELISASEPEKCVYEFEFKTPAMCTKKIDIDYGNIDEHDEL